MTDQTSKIIQAAAPYVAQDAVLAALYKDAREAQANFSKSSKDFGADSPMAEVAKGWLESALSALETRLIELREAGTQEAEAPAPSEQGDAALNEAFRALNKRQAGRQKEQNRGGDVLLFIAALHVLTRPVFPQHRAPHYSVA